MNNRSHLCSIIMHIFLISLENVLYLADLYNYKHIHYISTVALLSYNNYYRK